MSLFFLVLHLRNLAAKLNRPLLLLGSALEPQAVRCESQDQLLSETSPQPEVALQAQQRGWRLRHQEPKQKA